MIKPLKPLKPRASQTRVPSLPGAQPAAPPGRLQKALFNYLGFFVHLIACFPFTLILGFVGGAIIGLAGLKAGTTLSCIILALLFGSMSMLYGFLTVKLTAFFFRHNAVVLRHVTSGAIGFWLLASTLYIFSIPKAPAESVAVLVGCICNALSQYLTMQMLTSYLILLLSIILERKFVFDILATCIFSNRFLLLLHDFQVHFRCIFLPH